MKCDELKAYSFYVTVDYDIELHNEAKSFYSKDDVDAAIDELKEEIENACLERDDNQLAIDELRDDLRKTQRALWLARADRAKAEQYSISNAVLYLEYKFKHKFRGVRNELHVWGIVKRKCRNKAKEYE